MPKRQRREYLQYLDAAKAAVEAAIDAFNSVWHTYRYQSTLLLLSNACELLAKAILLHQKEVISKGKRGDTISAEVAVYRLQLKKELDQGQAETIQQVISLRNAASHGVLPDVPPEVMQHLLFYTCKFFRDLVTRHFATHAKSMNDNYLSLSFSDLTTYADRVQKSVAKIKKSPTEKRLVWLLERGVRFDGSSYITEPQFEKQYRDKKKILPHLGLSGFLRRADMVRIVPVQAPRNFTADLNLRKGSRADASLPVLIKKTDVEADYPYLTKELGAQVGKNQSWTAKAVAVLSLKGDPTYHQPVRASSTSIAHRYSTAALDALKKKLLNDPTFNPYHPGP